MHFSTRCAAPRLNESLIRVMRVRGPDSVDAKAVRDRLGPEAYAQHRHAAPKVRVDAFDSTESGAQEHRDAGLAADVVVRDSYDGHVEQQDEASKEVRAGQAGRGALAVAAIARSLRFLDCRRQPWFRSEKALVSQ